jgi:hypothetical protein
MSTTVVDDTVLLTSGQKMWLASRFIPVIAFVLALIFAVMVLPNMLGQAVPVLLPIFLVVLLLVLIYEASKSLRDLVSGVALVEQDELVRSWHSRNRGSIRYGKFARLGTLHMSRQAFNQGQAGQHYRVCYSPATRMVWSLEAK